MRILRGDYTGWDRLDEPTWLTIGVFDGVHLGHQSILDSLRAKARSGVVGVITFGEHPASIAAPENVPAMLSSLEQRLELFAAHGVGVTAILDFEQVHYMEPDGFVEEIVVGIMRATHVAVGDGFRFGYNMSGDQAVLTDLGSRFGFSVDVIDIMGGDSPVRSTAIRGSLADGDVESVATMLGHPFQLRGDVVVGDRRGRELGFPTANLDLARERAIPGRGVYSAMTRTSDGQWRRSVVNVGIRPTFGGLRETVEVHLLDVSMDLYGQELWVDFKRRIRPERRFDGIADLVEQIGRDITTAREHLEATTK